eukprot:scaffold21099_cov37-Attheya_sp.AAC.1
MSDIYVQDPRLIWILTNAFTMKSIVDENVSLLFKLNIHYFRRSLDSASNAFFLFFCGTQDIETLSTVLLQKEIKIDRGSSANAAKRAHPIPVGSFSEGGRGSRVANID